MHTARLLTGGGAAVHNRKWHHNTPYHHWQTDACEDIALSQTSFAGIKPYCCECLYEIQV